MKNPGNLIALFFLTCYLNGCSVLPNHWPYGSRDHAFIDYWPVPRESKQMRLAVKDNIDVKGVVTSAGSEYVIEHNPPAARDATCLAIARTRNVRIIGKTNLSEFAVAPSGLNDYFRTPENPLSKRCKLIPGGSSSGSAVAVAKGSADVAFGTDTAGSVRVPAACCGVVGLKTTFGLVSIKGIFPVEAKHLDTVGPIGKDVDHVVQGMDLLQDGFAARYHRAVANQPTASKIRIGRLYLSGTDPRIDAAVDKALAQGHFRVTTLGQGFKAKWDQAKTDGNTVAAAGAWLSDREYVARSGVQPRTVAVIILGRVLYPAQYQKALQRRAQWQHALNQVFKKVDFIALPTLQSLPPRIPSIGKIALLEARVLIMQNTVAVNYAGNPALALPIPVNDKTIPVTSLQLVGPRMSEAALLNVGRLIESERPQLERLIRPSKSARRQ
ncbi:MAG: amidase [Verrucomicrobia bacterium]|nr:amidase [Verrucomicrobiota bacterium]